jgi:threonylcarbamoyladenosine tRNA methylthiotransferase MtaB
MKSVFMLTLGCRTNQYDTAATEEALKSCGFTFAPDASRADVVILHTCSVTGRADSKCLQAVRKCVREAKGRTVIVSGCGPQADPARYLAVEGVSKVFGVNAADRIAAFLTGRKGAEENPFPSISRFSGRTRAHLKIQEGCDSFCAYCIVPYLRGKPVSRPFGDVLNQAGALLDGGFREIVLTGIHVGSYAWEGKTLADVVAGLAALAGNFRIRLSSIEPNEATDKLLDLVLGHEKVCNHLHLSLQSADNEVLRRMNRRYTAEDFFGLIGKIRERDALCGLGTDVITGFNGETEAAFQAACKRISESALTFGHVFPFSLRKGTAAEKMPGRIDRRACLERARRLKQVFTQLKASFLRGLVGKDLSVILETENAGLASNYVRVATEEKAPVNAILRMKALSAGGDKVIAGLNSEGEG